MSCTRSIVQIVSLDQTGDSKYRMQWPAETLASQNSTWSVCNVDSYHPDRYRLAKSADLLILFNCSDIDFLTVIEIRRNNGLSTLVEYNDNFYEPQPWSPVAKEWSSWQIHQIYELFMKNADAVIVTGKGLHKLFSSVTDKPIYIVENVLPFTASSCASVVSKKVEYSFGWAGSLGHISDILSVAPVINSIVSSNSECKFYVMGNESLASNLNITDRQFHFTPWGSVEQYYQFWQPIQVGLIPMLDTSYNECRSDIKVLEMISAGVLPIVPDLLPYKDLINKFNLPTYNNHESLKKAVIDSLNLSVTEKQQILEPAFDWIRQNRTSLNCQIRSELYNKYLSPVTQNSKSDFPIGYHHLLTLNKQPNADETYISELKKIQAIQKLGNQDLATEQLYRLHLESPHHPEICLSYVMHILQSDFPKGFELLKISAQKFPKDIRFQLKHISLTKSVIEQVILWRNLFGFLRTQQENYRKAVRENIATYFINYFKQPLSTITPEIIDVCEEFLLLYPFSYLVRFTLAECYEKRGSNKEAKGHFAALLQARRHYDEGVAEIAGLDYGYIAAWSEACDKRLKGTLR